MKYLAAILMVMSFVGCGANDVYQKYLQMKAESLWMLGTCEKEASKPIYIYKSVSASIRQSCKKQIRTDEWRERFQKSLTVKGWILHKTTTSKMYCLQKTGIALFLEENADSEGNTNMHYYYPSSECR